MLRTIDFNIAEFFYVSIRKKLGVIKLKMILGVEGVKPPTWGLRRERSVERHSPQTPFLQLIKATYLTQCDETI